MYPSSFLCLFTKTFQYKLDLVLPVQFILVESVYVLFLFDNCFNIVRFCFLIESKRNHTFTTLLVENSHLGTFFSKAIPGIRLESFW
jgi:hypothetical protein